MRCAARDLEADRPTARVVRAVLGPRAMSELKPGAEFVAAAIALVHEVLDDAPMNDDALFECAERVDTAVALLVDATRDARRARPVFSGGPDA